MRANRLADYKGGENLEERGERMVAEVKEAEQAVRGAWPAVVEVVVEDDDAAVCEGAADEDQIVVHAELPPSTLAMHIGASPLSKKKVGV